MKDLTFDWNDLKFFLAVARQGGLSGAATMLGTSASTVSRHVAALERRLGSNLFMRQQTGYLLTDDGSELLKRVEQVEQAMMAAERNADLASQREVSGQVRFATTEMLALHLIIPHLPEFRSRYPNLRIEINIGLTRANLSRREADLALRMVEPNPDEDAGDYIASRVAQIDFALYCAAGSAERSAVEQAPGAERRDAIPAIEHVSWGDNLPGMPTARWLREAFGEKTAVLNSNSLNAQYVAVRSGIGAGLLPCFVADKDSGLQRIGSERVLLSQDLWVVYHRDLKASRRVIALRDFVVGLLRTHLGSF